jgi:hypothetical protein
MASTLSTRPPKAIEHKITIIIATKNKINDRSQQFGARMFDG